MPKLKIAEEFKLVTRDRFTSVDCELSISIDGKELPNADVVGGALEKALTIISEHIQESYQKVPERV